MVDCTITEKSKVEPAAYRGGGHLAFSYSIICRTKANMTVKHYFPSFEINTKNLVRFVYNVILL